MNAQSLFGGIAIGRDTSGQTAVTTANQIAIRRPLDSDGYVSVVNGRLVDVTATIVSGAGDLVYRVPVKKAVKGDLIVIADRPLRVLAVNAVLPSGHLRGIDVETSTVTEYAPPQSAQGNDHLVKFTSIGDLASGGPIDPAALAILLSDVDGPQSAARTAAIVQVLLASQNATPTPKRSDPALNRRRVGVKKTQPPGAKKRTNAAKKAPRATKPRKRAG